MITKWGLTMRLSDAGLHRRQTKALYPKHRPSPRLIENDTRDRSNRLLDDYEPRHAPYRKLAPARKYKVTQN
jgi:hypothetical protein